MKRREDKSVWRSSNVVLFGLNEGQASPTRHPFNMKLEEEPKIELKIYPIRVAKRVDFSVRFDLIFAETDGGKHN